MDAPGPYVVVHKTLVVTAGAARSSGIVERIAAGRRVNVLEVEAEEGGSKIRGRIESPAGWITLLDQDRCLRGATPAQPRDGDVSPQPASPPGGRPAAAPSSEPGLGGRGADLPAAAAAAAAAPADAPPPALVAPPRAASAAPAPAAGSTAPPPAGAPAGAAGRAGAPGGRAERLRRLEAEARDLRAATAGLEAELNAERQHCAELQARWADMSGMSDDALTDVDEARRRSSALRRAIEDKEAKLETAEAERERLAAEAQRAKSELAALEVAFQERLKREVGQKEQELQEEKIALKRAGDASEKKVQELSAEKAFLEQRLLTRSATDAESGAGSAGGGHAAMLEAHMAIAHAFGGLALEHPCLRLLDEPTLKVTVLLFKQPLVRRIFLGFSSVMWLFALRAATVQQGGAPVHV